MAAPSQRLLLSVTPLRRHAQIHPLLPLCTYHRTLFDRFFKRKQRHTRRGPPRKADTSSKVIDISSPEFKEKTKAAGTSGPTSIDDIPKGKLAPSIFDQELPPVPKPVADAAGPPDTPRGPPKPAQKIILRELKPTGIDPRPRARVRWQRKKVIQSVRKGGRLTKAEKLLLTERFHLAKSPMIKTSIKKLGPLARQIAGKPLTEAMVQMRFSKKKAAQDMLKHLQYARNQAIVSKGMGLGKVVVKEEGQESQDVQAAEEERLVVQDKAGKKRIVTDRTAMYVDEAWVGRGTPQYGTDYRARGKANRLTLPYTSVSVVLKEEATRIRLAEEREQKRLRKKVWVPLPDRPITAQRQYPLW